MFISILVIVIGFLIWCLLAALIGIMLRPRVDADIMQQAIGDAPRFQRHVRSVEEEAL